MYCEGRTERVCIEDGWGEGWERMMSQGSSQVFGLSTWMMEFPFVELEKTMDGGGSFCVFLCQSLVDRASPFSVFGTSGWEVGLALWEKSGGVEEDSKS